MKKLQVKHRVFVAHVYVLVWVMISAMLLGGCSGTEQQVNADEIGDVTYISEDDVYTDGIYTEPPVLPPIEVVMDDYSFDYSGERASAISTEVTNDGMEFFAELTNEKAPIFTLVYNSQEGDIVTVLISESGERVPVAVMMFEMPEGLSEEDEQNFILAQEAVNEIVESIKPR